MPKKWLPAALALAPAVLPLAACQPPPPETPLWLNTAVGAPPNCPQIAWRISVMNIEQTIGLAGTAWFTDGSGISQVRGAATTEGRFNLVVTPISGNGPRGEVSGFRYKDGSTDIRLTGPGCSNVNVRVPPGATQT
jgi:hypothetical protein